MVSFEAAKPKKTEYRMFKIQSVEGEPNDFASMKEAVGRRYARLIREQKPFPDLIIIDGGKGQLGAAMEALTALELGGLKIGDHEFSIVGLAKKQEEVYFPNRSMPVYIPRRSEALHLLQAVRDEAHRFAVTFHRKLRAKRVIASQLDVLKGLGAKRRKKLIDHFGSFEQIKSATLEEIEACEGIPKKLALELFTFMQDLKNKPKAKPILTGMEPADHSEADADASDAAANVSGKALATVAEDAGQYEDGEIKEVSILDQEDEEEFYAEDVEPDEERLPEPGDE
jgi:hypothetical protein